MPNLAALAALLGGGLQGLGSASDDALRRQREAALDAHAADAQRFGQGIQSANATMAAREQGFVPMPTGALDAVAAASRAPAFDPIGRSALHALETSSRQRGAVQVPGADGTPQQLQYNALADPRLQQQQVARQQMLDQNSLSERRDAATRTFEGERDTSRAKLDRDLAAMRERGDNARSGAAQSNALKLEQIRLEGRLQEIAAQNAGELERTRVAAGAKTAAAPSESELKSAAMIPRAVEAHKYLTSLTDEKGNEKPTMPGSFTSTMALGNHWWATNKFANAEAQRWHAAATAFATSVLRPESGATIGPSEFQQITDMAIPVASDAPQVKRDKVKNRETILRQIAAMGGRATTTELRQMVDAATSGQGAAAAPSAGDADVAQKRADWDAAAAWARTHNPQRIAELGPRP